MFAHKVLVTDPRRVANICLLTSLARLASVSSVFHADLARCRGGGFPRPGLPTPGKERQERGGEGINAVLKGG